MAVQVSIVIPVFNVEEYLDNCLKSVLRQSLNDYEIILVDDGSTDRSKGICDIYEKAYPFIKTIHKKNGGLSSARNVGLKKATGKYIYFLDGDDTITKDMLSDIIPLMKNNNLDAYGFSALVVYSDYTEILHHNIHQNECNKVLKGLYVMTEHVPLSTVPLYIFRTSFLKDNDLLFWEGVYYEDMDFSVRFFLEDPSIEYTRNIYYNYFRRDDSITSFVNIKKFKDMCKICQNFISMYKNLNEYGKEAMKTVLPTYLLVMQERYIQLSKKDKVTARTYRGRVLISCQTSKIGSKVLAISKCLPLILHIRNMRRTLFEMFKIK